MAQLSQLLLFDPDPSGLDTLTYGFEKDHCSVTGTADASTARDLVQTPNLSLLLVNLRESEQIGLDLLRATTAGAKTRNLPCVAIGRDDLRASALAAGAFAFISVPVFVRDVISVCRMVAAASVPGSRPSPDGELKLELKDVDGIYFLVRALAVTGRSTVIEARHGRNRGELRFMDGTLNSAVVGNVQGLAALHQMLLWEDASLHFKFKNVVRRGTQLSMKSSEVLEECDRFLRDFAHEAKDLGVARTIYSAELDRVQPSAALPSEVVPILKLFNGQRDLAQILDESPFRIFDTFKIIKRFVTDGAIQLKTPLPPPRADLSAGAGGTAVSGPGALDHWLQKPAPMLGTVLLASKAGGINGTTTAGGSAPASSAGIPNPRPTSPFVPLSAATGAPLSVAATPPPLPVSSPSPPQAERRSHGGNRGAVSQLRARTVTKRNVAEATATFPEDMVTPPPVVVRPTEAPVPPGDSATRRAPAVARGEIRITPVPQDRSRDRLVEKQASVLVELGDLPTPRPLASTVPPPVSARSPAPLPSVIIAPMTPAPVIVGALPTAATTPPPALAAAAPTTPPPAVAPPAALPAVIIAPLTPAPVVSAPPVGHEIAAAALVPAPAVVVASGEGEVKRHGRSPSDNFNAIESDFFEREADLYKRESVESFEDLDSGKNTNGTGKR